MSNAATLSRLAAHVFNTPLLIHPGKLDAIIAGLGGRFLGAPIENAAAPQLYTTPQGERAKPGYRVIDGVAVIDIFGVLAHRGGIDAESNYILGYQTIARQFEAALADAGVKSVLLNMDTPGGEVAGAFDLAQQIFNARGTKPIHAIASDMAASAGYLIASAADSLAITQTGYAGSIGVVMRHVDFSQALATEGIRVTHIFAGAHKVDGNPYQPLPEGVRADFQTEIDGLYDMFVSAVAKHRGLDPAAIRATEAGVLRGLDAVQAGLANRVATPDQLISELRAAKPAARSLRATPSATRANSTRRTSMDESNTPAGGANTEPVHTQADLDRAKTEAHAAGVQVGTKAERERASAIYGHAEAAGRSALAHQCVATGLSVEQSAAILAAAPKEAAASGNAFTAAMANVPNPDVKPESDGNGTDSATAIAGRITSMFNRTPK